MQCITQTPRLMLREFKACDAASFYHLNNDPEVLRFTGDVPFEDIEDARRFLHFYNDYEKNAMGRWAVIRKTDLKWLGWCGLKKHDGFIDLGFRFFKEEWGKGYATEAATASLNYGFRELGLATIVGRCMPENTASVKVLEKVGMTYWKEEEVTGLHKARWYQISSPF